jgi:hypothetical protein
MLPEEAEFLHQPLKASVRLAEVLATGLEPSEIAATPLPRQECFKEGSSSSDADTNTLTFLLR